VKGSSVFGLSDWRGWIIDYLWGSILVLVKRFATSGEDKLQNAPLENGSIVPCRDPLNCAM